MQVIAARNPVYRFSFAFFAMLITGTAMRATTTGRIPLKTLTTVGLSWYPVKNIAIRSIMIKEGSMDSSVELRNKKDLIERFIDSLNPSSNVDDDWHSFVDAKKVEELDKIIEEESLNKEETYHFINNAFRDGYVQTTGTAITKVLPPVSRFTPTGDRTKKRESVLEKLSSFFNKFWDISGGRFLKN